MSPSGVLTPRESEILQLIYRGKTNIEIGAALGIHPLTVKHHVRKILRKLHAQNRTEAVARAVTLSLLVPDTSEGAA